MTNRNANCRMYLCIFEKLSGECYFHSWENVFNNNEIQTIMTKYVNIFVSYFISRFKWIIIIIFIIIIVWNKVFIQKKELQNFNKKLFVFMIIVTLVLFDNFARWPLKLHNWSCWVLLWKQTLKLGDRDLIKFHHYVHHCHHHHIWGS